MNGPLVDDSKIFEVRDLFEKIKEGKKLSEKEKKILRKLGLEIDEEKL